jgi:hypothetical protein
MQASDKVGVVMNYENITIVAEPSGVGEEQVIRTLKQQYGFEFLALYLLRKIEDHLETIASASVTDITKGCRSSVEILDEIAEKLSEVSR